MPGNTEIILLGRGIDYEGKSKKSGKALELENDQRGTRVVLYSFASLAESNVQQTATALDALWACSYLIPGIGCVLAAVIMMFYGLKDKDAQLMAECNAGRITREECEAKLSKKN